MRPTQGSIILSLPTFLIFSIFWIFSIGGCASTQEKKTLSPAELLKKGKNFVKLKETQKAKEVFQQVLEDFPDSKERKAALLYLADVHYRDGEYEEAKFHNQKFIELYPANPRADRAHYYKAMSDYQMMEIASRDQTHTHAALEGFETVVKNFPNSPYHPKAVQKKEECLRILAKSSFEIGKFYYRIKSYQSAIARLKNLMKEFPDQAFVEEAIYLIAESYYNEENYEKARDNYLKLLNKYPRSQYAKEARNRLRTLR